MWYGPRTGRQTDKRNRIQTPEIDLHLQNYLNFWQMCQSSLMGKESFLTNSAGKKPKWSCLTRFINAKESINVNIKAKTLTPLGREQKKISSWPWLCKAFFYIKKTQKILAIKESSWWNGLHQDLKLLLIKVNGKSWIRKNICKTYIWKRTHPEYIRISIT